MDASQQSAQTFEVTPQNFQSHVIDRSRQAPVILLFWAPEVIPSAEMRRALENVARGYQGKVFIALVDVARDPTLAQHLRVQGLPSLRVVQNGQLVHQMDGAQPESTLRALLDQLTLSSAELLKEDLAALLEAGDYRRALTLLQQAIDEEPQNAAFKVELADVLARQGQAEEARRVLAAVPEGTDERDRPETRIELLEEAAGFEPLEELEAALAKDPADLETRYRLAVRAAVAGDYQRALDEALTILRTDRAFRDDLGRLTMIRVFKLMGKGSELASRYRRTMFNYLH
ncbi:MAG TPA: tetratricopeptide repeat protein [Pseudomonadales bacterium]